MNVEDMEEDRSKKVELGREKLAAYKRRKHGKGKSYNESGSTSQSSDSSLSLSPTMLPENNSKKISGSVQEPASGSSSISEHIFSNDESIENDRSFQEIEISNTPSNLNLILHDLSAGNDVDNISQENKPSPLYSASLKSDHSLLSANLVDKIDAVSMLPFDPDSAKNVQSILEEILHNEQFKSESEHTLQKSEVTFDSNEDSINIFEGVNLDDSSINNYVSRLKNDVNASGKNSLIDARVPFCGTSDTSVFVNRDINLSEVSFIKPKDYEDVIAAKDATIAVLTAELDSFREMASNHSTMSLNTTTTDYKLYHDEFQNKIVEFQNALAHRDEIIQQLTESLQQSIVNRDDLQSQSQHLASEIITLQQQLAETTKIIKNHQCVATKQEEALNEESSLSTIKEVADTSLEESLEPIVEKKEFEVHKHEKLQDECQTQQAQKLVAQNEEVNLEEECAKLEETLSPVQLNIMNELKIAINMFIQKSIAENKANQQTEIKILKDKFENEKNEYEIEMTRLRNLLASVKCGSTEIMELRQELDTKHGKEMEELRTYFEQKCSDMEKHYSEEIFSQQSRRMSGSSSLSEVELPSDFLYSNNNPQPGPGGDTLPNIGLLKQDKPKDLLSKQDFIRLKAELTKVLNELNRFDLDNITKEELTQVNSEINNFDMKALAKYDLSKIKTELQNKYHAELEILREDYENRIDLLNVEHEAKLQSLEKRYEDKMESLKFDLEEALRNNEISVSTAVQEVASSGEYELAEVVQSYERRLQEQVMLAKIDIIAALEHQIQVLCASSVDDAVWPPELLQLRDRFTEKYEAEIADLKDQHQQEISQLKEEHLKNLNGALERARRRSLKESDVAGLTDLDIGKERDHCKKTAQALRQLLRELLKYFTDCEDELNNTLVEEMLRKNCEKNLTQLEADFNLDTSSSSSMCISELEPTKRVHFTPNFSDFLNVLDSSTLSSLECKDFSSDLKNELGSCLDRLKADANAVLALTMNLQENKESVVDAKPVLARSVSLEDKITSLTRQLMAENQLKNELTDEINKLKEYTSNLESERVIMENQAEEFLAKQRVLENDLLRARDKIAELIECGHKEIISEGYGESHSVGVRGIEAKKITLSDLQEKARVLVAETASAADHPLIQLIDELCREGDAILEEAKKEQEDLLQQIDAADKKIRANCKFLEEQAAEREQERDEFQKEIASLKEQLRERDKDRVSFERVTKEVEHLEQQMREMTKILEENEVRHQEVEKERNEAVDQIFLLRDVVKGLESQVIKKAEKEAELRAIIQGLEELVKQQSRSNTELNEELHSLKGDVDINDYREHVAHLEEEVQKLRLSSELVGSEGALYQLKTQLHELEVSIEKRTKDLEGLHSAISTTSCSSPTEDMSIRDQIRPQTPSNILDECDVPLQQLARLKEKLIKHSRAEDAAVKRIRDLEMQLIGSRTEFEEIQNEKDMLQDQVSEQLILISSLQMRLDEQRLRAEHVEKQTNTSLEVRIYDLENELQNLRELIHQKDNTIKQLNRAFEQTKQRLLDREKELSALVEDNSVTEELEKLRLENAILKSKIESDSQSAQILPNLVDNILADKNADIEKLREELDETKKQLHGYATLNLDSEQLRMLSILKSRDNTLGNILSLLEMDEPDRLRRADSHVESLSSSSFGIYKRNANETIPFGASSKSLSFEPEISRIVKVGLETNFTANLPSGKQNSTEIHKQVHFKDTNEEVTQLKAELLAKDEIIKEYNERLNILGQLEENINQLQSNLEITEDALKKATETFEKEQNELKEVERQLRLDLAEKKMKLTEREKELEQVNQDSIRKDQMYMSLTKEKCELEKELNELSNKLEKSKEFDALISEKNEQISFLEAQLKELNESKKKFEELGMQLRAKSRELELLEEKYVSVERDIADKNSSIRNLEKRIQEENEKNIKLKKELYNKNSQLESLSGEFNSLKDQIQKESENAAVLEEKQSDSLKILQGRVKELEDLVVDRECELEILNEDNVRYQNEIIKLEAKLDSIGAPDTSMELQLMKNRKQIAEKDLEIVKLKDALDNLKKEVIHLQDFLTEKDKIIDQMKQDSKSLQINLKAIQNKMVESGNVIDLKSKLAEQEHINAILQEEINALKTSNSKPIDMSASIEEIAGKVQKELNYSAQLDSNILNALSSGDDLDIHENDIDLLRMALNKEKNTNKELTSTKLSLQNQVQQLQIKLEREIETVKQQQLSLENEKRKLTSIQLEDGNLIEKLHAHLKNALESENELKKFIEDEQVKRQELEIQLNILKQKASNLSSSSNSKTELTEYKSLPTLQAQEIMQLRNDLLKVKEENERLSSEVKKLHRGRRENDANKKYLSDMLDVKAKEIEKLESCIEDLRKEQRSIKEHLIQSKVLVDKKTQELENTVTLMNELEEEKLGLKNMIERLNEKIVELEEQKQIAESLQQELGAQMDSAVPEKFMKKMKELSNLVRDHVRDNKVMVETISKLTDERRLLQEKISQLEEDQHSKLPFEDPTARANHLFGKYLRSESYRKALVWQKRYLISLLVTYQNIHTPQILVNFEPKYPVQVRNKGKSRFRSVAVSVIAILRMQYLVQRWNTGIRLASQKSFSYYQKAVNNTHVLPHNHPNVPLMPGAQFQVGQPVSSQNFPNPDFLNRHPNNMHCSQRIHFDDGGMVNSNTHIINTAQYHHPVPGTSRDGAFGGYNPHGNSHSNSSIPWSGSSPPSKDNAHVNRIQHIDPPIAHRQPLKSPELLAKCVERFSQIQTRLGLTFDNVS